MKYKHKKFSDFSLWPARKI